MHRLIPVRYLDEAGLTLYRRLAASRGDTERRRAAAALLDRLCELGYMKLMQREEIDGEIRSTYRNLVSLDTLALSSSAIAGPNGDDDRQTSQVIDPTAQAADHTAGPVDPTTTGENHRSEDIPSAPGPASAVPWSILNAIAASSRRIDLAGPLLYLHEFLDQTLRCEHVRLHLSDNLMASQANSLTDIEDIMASSDDDLVCPAWLREQVENNATPLSVRDISTDERFVRQRGVPPFGSCIVAPLVAEAYVYGTLEVWSSRKDAFSAGDVSIVSFVAEFASGLIRRRLEIEELIFVDPTTQIHNRRYFEEQLIRELERSKRTAHPMALLIIDIDDFKQVNDTYGHTAGDSVLRQMGRVLLENARTVDIVARFGGEEFAVILPRITRDSALTVAERMRESVAGHEFITGVTAEPLRGMTISIGGALYPLDASTKSELLDRADRVSLYEAKRGGKNRVIFWQDTHRT